MSQRRPPLRKPWNPNDLGFLLQFVLLVLASWWLCVASTSATLVSLHHMMAVESMESSLSYHCLTKPSSESMSAKPELIQGQISAAHF